jgi:hypothetical protein
MALDLTSCLFTQAEVLTITKLRKEVLQTWINRDVITLGEQYPGKGKRRLYSAIDIVKVAIFRRIADLNLALGVGRALAGEAEQLLLDRRDVEWNRHYFISGSDTAQRDYFAATGLSVARGVDST